MFAKVGATREPIATQSNKTNDSDIVIVINSWKCSFVEPSVQVLLWNKIPIQRWVVSSKEIFVKSNPITKLVIAKL